jgi:RHS repeat-associated protein
MFKGEYYDPVIGAYSLGMGHRFYSTSLMRFYTSDTHSPFGAGGLNSYAFCLGDPVNHSDPKGRWSELKHGFFKKLGLRRQRSPYQSQKQKDNFKKAILSYQEEREKLADTAHTFVIDNHNKYPVTKKILSYLPESYGRIMPGIHFGNLTDKIMIEEFFAERSIEMLEQARTVTMASAVSAGLQSEVKGLINAYDDVIQEKLRNIRAIEKVLLKLRF